jgi:hypothetical protein
LKRHGVPDAAISVMLIDNPRKVFHLADSRLAMSATMGPLEIEVAVQANRVSVHLPVFNAFTAFLAFRP